MNDSLDDFGIPQSSTSREAADRFIARIHRQQLSCAGHKRAEEAPNPDAMPQKPQPPLQMPRTSRHFLAKAES